MREVLAGKYVGETKSYSFDFSSLAQPADLFVGAVAAISLYSGVVGALPTLGSPTISSNVALLQVSGGIVGNIYVIVVTGTSGAGQISSLNAFLPILPGQP